MGSFRRLSLFAATLCSAFLLQACAALPPLPPRTASRAIDPGTPSPLAQRVAAERAGVSPQHSGVRLLAGGEEALATLIALADQAEHTLDLQYYAVLNEASSRALLQRVRAAAERGVRVRLLIDDFNTSGTDDALLRLTRHPKIEVRLYNPLPAGRFSIVTRVMASLHDIGRINSRMHNKQLVADNALAVTGGRNLGDAYFLQAAEANFVDLDVLVAGPVVQQLSATFDRYWNSELAYPADTIIPASAAASEPQASAPSALPQARAQAPAAGRTAREDPAPAASAPPLPPAASVPLDAPSGLAPETVARLREQVDQQRKAPLKLQWMPARLWADRPSKSLQQGTPSPDEIMFDDFTGLMRSARSEVFLITPYFVPGQGGMALIRDMRARGVRVRILTASLAGTDAPAVHIGYSRYREGLLAMGVELFELRAEPGGPQPPRWGGVHSRTNLHAKAMLVDGRTVVVGSMNFDPRSENLNTEMGLVMRSPALAKQLEGLLADIMRTGAYRLDLDGEGRGLRWTLTDEQGGRSVSTREPDVSMLKLLGLKLISPLAPEEML
ncbi:phospholipase D family protein [Aquincola sp. MAHUQ-54]|uniref:Phospholipase D family protein n=1 Tax=Aquincola agrisoli TaxID=3119538 RepID=A0AAW9QPC1_9BURK